MSNAGTGMGAVHYLKSGAPNEDIVQYHLT